MADSMDSNFAQIAADGSVTFVFTGSIKAQGLNLDLNTGGALNPINSVNWLRPSDQLLGATLMGFDSGAGDGVMQMEGIDPDSVGADFALLRAFGVAALNSSKIEVLLAGNNGNQQSGARRLLQLANGAGGSPPYVSDWCLDSPARTSSGLVRCFRCLTGATAYTAADSNGRLYTPALASAYDPTLVFGASLIFTAPYDCFVILNTGIYDLTAAAGSNIGVATLLNSGADQKPSDTDVLAKGAAPAISGITQNLFTNIANGSDLRLFSYCSAGGNFQGSMNGFILPNRGQIP
jgi:hypothetical protein